jgi:phosphate:Na+ symporter
MDIFDFFSMIGGLSLFLFGMNLMGQALERKAGNRLKELLTKMTGSKIKGFLTGLVITAIIQSSSATTVMVVGFVNSGIMTLNQAIGVIMGANIGTTMTAWILSLSGISGTGMIMRFLNPSTFTPILAFVGILYYMFMNEKKKDTGMIFLGFATLMYGMSIMSDSVSGLANVPEFAQAFLLFTNPIFGVLAGMILTAIIQSSSASVGILQALSTTGKVTYSAAIPIIMGQNIGTCVTALLSSIGTNKNARRAAVVHLLFNVVGTITMLILFCIVKQIFSPSILLENATSFGIAVCHSMFNIFCVMLLYPMSSLLEKAALTLIPDDKSKETYQALDERLFVTPSLALGQCEAMLEDMANVAKDAINKATKCLENYSDSLYKSVVKDEEKNDKYEDELDTYLVKLSSKNTLNEKESSDVSHYLKTTTDFERMSDHAINIAESSKKLRDEKLSFSLEAVKEIDVMIGAVNEIIYLANKAYKDKDLNLAYNVGPLEEIIDELKEELKARHIDRVKKGLCSVEAGFIWLDLLTDLERVGDHCNNIAIELIDYLNFDNMRSHKTKMHIGDDEKFDHKYKEYASKYSLEK